MRRGTKRLSEDRRSPREDSPEREKLGCGLRFYLMMAVAVSVFAFGLTVISVYAPGLIRPRPPSQISTSDATPPAAAAVVDSEDPEGPPPPGLLAPAVDSTPLGQASADGSAGAEEPQSFAHEEDPIPFGHEEIDRPLSGRGCTFRLCNQQSGQWRVGGVRRTTLPLVYIVIPHRNRLDNMARLLSSLVNATSPAQRACMCVIVTDFNTSTTAIAPWKNVHCLVSYRPEYNIWMDDEAYYRGKKLTRGELKSQASTYASAPECPDVSLQREELRAANRGGWRSVNSAFPPVHLDVAGLTGRQALRYTLSFYDGESAIVDGNAYVHNPKIAFSRAGGIMGGFDAIQTPVGASLVFVCDADVIIRPGFFEELVDVPVAGSIVFYPIVWSMCWGTVLEDAPHRSNWRSSAKGGWRPGGAGMVAGYLQDFRSVGGMRCVILLLYARGWRCSAPCKVHSLFTAGGCMMLAECDGGPLHIMHRLHPCTLHCIAHATLAHWLAER